MKRRSTGWRHLFYNAPMKKNEEERLTKQKHAKRTITIRTKSLGYTARITESLARILLKVTLSFTLDDINTSLLTSLCRIPITQTTQHRLTTQHEFTMWHARWNLPHWMTNAMRYDYMASATHGRQKYQPITWETIHFGAKLHNRPDIWLNRSFTLKSKQANTWSYHAPDVQLRNHKGGK